MLRSLFELNSLIYDLQSRLSWFCQTLTLSLQTFRDAIYTSTTRWSYWVEQAKILFYFPFYFASSDPHTDLLLTLREEIARTPGS